MLDAYLHPSKTPGITHPCGFGLASHLGLWLDLPTVGCAKRLLCGTYEKPGRQSGNRAFLVNRGLVVGAVLTMRDGIKPLYVSLVQLLNMPAPADRVMRCLGRFRLPDPIRLLANQARRKGRPAAVRSVFVCFSPWEAVGLSMGRLQIRLLGPTATTIQLQTS